MEIKIEMQTLDHSESHLFDESSLIEAEDMKLKFYLLIYANNIAEAVAVAQSDICDRFLFFIASI